MSVSGTNNFNTTRDQLVRDALEEIRVLGAEDPLSAADLQKGVRYLNAMIYAWAKKQIYIWKNQSAAVFITPDDIEFTLGGANTVHASDEYHNTTLEANYTTGDTLLSVTSSSGMAVADNIGIEMDDGTRFWTTISAVNSSTAVTITDALEGDTTESNTVFTYTTALTKPLNIIDCRRNNSYGNQKKMYIYNYDKYMDIVVKTPGSSDPSIFMYEPRLTEGLLHVWPPTNDIRSFLNINYHKAIFDVGGAGNNLDFPPEWAEALRLNLAVRLLHPFGRAGMEGVAQLKQDALMAFQDISMADHEFAPYQVQPDSFSYGY